MLSNWKKVSESIKPKGILYTLTCGHEVFVSQEEVLAYVKWDEEGGANPAPEVVPDSCPECDGIIAELKGAAGVLKAVK